MDKKVKEGSKKLGRNKIKNEIRDKTKEYKETEQTKKEGDKKGGRDKQIIIIKT